MGISFIINALGSVHTNWLVRDLDYRRKLIPDLGSPLIKAWSRSDGLPGVWCLVIGLWTNCGCDCICGARLDCLALAASLTLDRKIARGLNEVWYIGDSD